MKVMKFGGATIKDPKMMKDVGNIIQKEKGKKVVVVSALSGQTNEIREFIAQSRIKRHEVDEFIKKIWKRHTFMVKKTISDKTVLKDILETLNKHILRLERLLYGVVYTEELTPRTKDLILSFGERASAYIMEGMLLSKNVKAKAYEADLAGVVTDGIFLNATADLIKTKENLKKNILPGIQKGTIPVITGFFGCDSKGRTTTFGKNGSDYSAAVIANALNADILELWKDVDGFMSANPSIIENAHTIQRLSYDEAAELAYFGIGLLHPRTVQPAREKDIPIVIKNILKPNKDGTTIEKTGFKTEKVIKSVVYSKDLIEIKVSGAGAGYRPGVLKEVTSTLGDSNINIYSVSTSHTQLSLLIHKNDLSICNEALNGVQGGVIEHIDHLSDIALVCVVGEGSRENRGLAGKIFSAVSKAGVNVEMISAGASSVASHFIIKRIDLKKTISAIHQTFCEK
ncbi:MAG: aspartate kinase [Thermoplasmata archaeon]|nr:MAG: aspartate kinase [Thermoplasmata archaeon]